MIREIARQIEGYICFLEKEERSLSTRRQYQRDIQCFLVYVQGRAVTKELVIQYKERLMSEYQPSSVNTKLAAINGYFSYLGKRELCVKQLKIQKKVYCPREKELTKADYRNLVCEADRKKNKRLSLLIQTICATGIRVSELSCVTAEAVKSGEACTHLKGKSRVVLLNGKLRKALRDYLRHEKIVSGPVFRTRTGRPLDRSNIWKMMKRLCAGAKVEPQKVFPHNLRHLFARCFYALDKDIAKLADILGHSSINTTRIYIMSSGQEHRRRMDALKLVL